MTPLPLTALLLLLPSLCLAESLPPGAERALRPLADLRGRGGLSQAEKSERLSGLSGGAQGRLREVEAEAADPLGPGSRELLRRLRALEVLARVGARDLLEEMSGKAPWARERQEALR